MRLVVLLVFVPLLLAACGETAPPEPPPAVSDPVLAGGFVGSQACRTCHEDRHTTWLGTGHAYSLREPGADSVVGRFDGEPVTIPGGVVTPYRLVDQYRMAVESDGGLEGGDFVVSRVVGKTFEQAFLTQREDGGSRLLPLSWSIANGAWDATARVLAEITSLEAHVVAGSGQRLVFEDGCAQCHATGFDAGFDTGTSTYAPTMVEGAVSCETCHGPGADHTAWHRAHEGVGEAVPGAVRLVNPATDLDPRQVLDACARCHYLHEWRYAIDDDPAVGHADLAITRNVAGATFFADGRISGLAYHGTTQSQSACFLEGGMSCLHCHDLHGENERALRWPEATDAQCLPCHRPIVEDPTPHTHHEATLCVDCHMPRLLGGVLHAYRDHSLGSPQPVLTERFGTELAPNACTVCHADQPVSWAREKRTAWWGPTDPGLIRRVETIALLRSTPLAVDHARLVALAADVEAKPFFRNSALAALKRSRRDRPFAELLHLLADPATEIRQLLCEGLFERPDPGAIEALGGVFDDPVRTVRVEAVAAALVAGWRGDREVLRRAHEDALGMLERRKPDAATLERVLYVAFAVDDGATFDRAWTAWTRTVDLRGAGLGESGAGLLARRAQRLAAAGHAEEARNLLGSVEGQAIVQVREAVQRLEPPTRGVPDGGDGGAAGREE